MLDEHDDGTLDLLDDDDKDPTLDDQGGDKKEDRGDELPGEPSADDLKDLAKGDEDDKPKADENQDDETKDEDKEEKKGSAAVPHARFNEVNEQLKAERLARAQLEQQLAALQGKQEPEKKPDPVPTFDMEAKEKEYMELMLEGETDKALKVRTEINAHILEEAERKAEQKAETRVSARKAEELFNSVAAKAETDYPQLVPGSENADPEAIDDVVMFRDQYIRSGDAIHVALEKAVNKVAKLYGWKDANKQQKQDQRPQVDEAERKKKEEEATTRGAKASNAQAPAPKEGVGERAATPLKLDPSKMTEEEWEKLPLSEKRRLRGD